MRTFRATSPRNGLSVRRAIDASTPRRCNSSTIRSRVRPPKPFRAIYHPPLIAAAMTRTTANRRIERASRCAKGGGRSCAELVDGSSMTCGIYCRAFLRTPNAFGDTEALQSAPVNRHDNKRSARDQCVAQRSQHHFHFSGLVLDPAQHLAAPRPVHDRRPDRVERFPGRLHYLSLARRRKIFRLFRFDRVDLFPASHYPRATRVRDLAVSDPDARPYFSTPLGSTSTAWSLDHADLAVCVGHRCPCLFHPLPLVPAAESCTWPVVDVCSRTQLRGKISHGDDRDI